jgi:GH25 family lysozyme M1 (1,4-beta-N-acetylmuramidase)
VPASAAPTTAPAALPSAEAAVGKSKDDPTDLAALRRNGASMGTSRTDAKAHLGPQPRPSATGGAGSRSIAGLLQLPSVNYGEPSVPEQPPSTVGQPLGLDVSGWQGNVDWNYVRSKGARFAYIKASEGTWSSNSYFAQQYNGAASVGLIRGSYHFARPNLSTGAAQADAFVASGGGWSPDGITLPGVLDIEDHPSFYNGDPYNEGLNRCYSMSPGQLEAWVADFTSRYMAQTGKQAVIYTSYSFWNECLGGSTRFASTNPLWAAAWWADSPWMFGGWGRYTFWQYADQYADQAQTKVATFPGDQDVFYGSMDQLRSFASTSDVPPLKLSTAYLVTGVHDSTSDGNGDVVTRTGDGTLRLYSGTGTGAFQPARTIGTGWNIYDLLLGTGDANGDGKPDLIARRPDGTLWFYAGDGAGGYGDARQIGTGWSAFTQLIDAGDNNADGIPDILALTADGVLWFYAGDGTGGYRTGQRVGSGWDVYNLVTGISDFNSDGRPDLLARKPDGTIFFYAGDGNGGYAPARQIGSGWQIYDQILGVGDDNKDGRSDLLGRRPDGSIWFYAGDGMRMEGYQPMKQVGSGWQIFSILTGVGDATADGNGDVVGVQASGTLWHYAGDGAGGYRTGVAVGSGWTIYDRLTGVGDTNRDGRTDLVARRPDGTLWFYAGDGAGNYRDARQIGTGWNVFSQLVNAGDSNGDGIPDLVAMTPDGGLWFYAGDGTGGYRTGRLIGTGWNIFNLLIGVGDFDSDGVPDLLARHPNGSLWFYAGDGTGGYHTGRQIGTGWGVYDLIVGTGDNNRDGKPDFIGRRADGTLWFYAGDGMPKEGYLPMRAAGSL